jgi:hypothetical protein
MAVIIDGVVYVPRAEIPEITDDSIQQALMALTEIQYFNVEHKSRAIAWNALKALAPELAELAAKDPEAAYKRVRCHDPFFDDEDS